ncbi:MAG TPA: sigma-70 family RNA polymerase sigma factor [Flavihumibacter sp.]|jgi:RNA polymerase sigma factor (sigma-70 family)
MPKQVDDTASDLFVQLSDGSIDALNKLMQGFKASLLHHITRLVRDRQWAEEIFMDVILAVWEQRRNLAVKRDPVGWIFRIARNRAINRMRAANQRRRFFLEYVKTLNQLSNPVYAWLEKRDFQIRLENALGKLGKRRALIFRMHVLEGKSGREIASILGLSENTVRNHLARARIRLRRLLAYQ